MADTLLAKRPNSPAVMAGSLAGIQAPHLELPASTGNSKWKFFALLFWALLPQANGSHAHTLRLYTVLISSSQRCRANEINFIPSSPLALEAENWSPHRPPNFRGSTLTKKRDSKSRHTYRLRRTSVRHTGRRCTAQTLGGTASTCCMLLFPIHTRRLAAQSQAAPGRGRQPNPPHCSPTLVFPRARHPTDLAGAPHKIISNIHPRHLQVKYL